MHAKLGAAGGGHHDWTQNDTTWGGFKKLVEAAYAAGIPNAPVPNPSPAPAPPLNYQPNPSPRIDDIDAKIRAARDLEYAVKTFQKSAGLSVDGDPGPDTRAALIEALAA